MAPALTDSDELLDAVVAAPNDDAPRLVYADWLLERGDFRGHFIVAQCTLSACEKADDLTSERYRAAWAVEQAFLRDHKGRLAAAFGIGPVAAVNTFFERGFPTASTVDLREDDAEALARLPFQRLSLQHSQPLTVGELRRVFAGPLPASLELLSFGKALVSVDIDVALAREALARTRVPDDIRVWPDDREMPITPFDEIVRRYAGQVTLDAPLPPMLRDLVFTITNGDAAALARRLGDLGRTEIQELAVYCDTNEEARAVIDTVPFDRLSDFSLIGQRDYDLAASAAFAEAAAGVERLRGLECTFPIDDRIARALERAPLRLLRATGGGTAVGLARMFERHPLHTIELASVSAAEAVRLLADHAPASLSNLAFDWMTFDDDEVRALANAERLEHVVDLWFYECPMREPSIDLLLAAPSLSRVRRVRFNAEARRDVRDVIEKQL